MFNLSAKKVKFILMAAMIPLTGCVTGGAVQPDRSIFALDGNYQRFAYAFPIEDTFDRTARVFKEAGYRLDVVDRATGQISGQRGRGIGDASHGSTDKGQKFYALVMPAGEGQSQVAVKIVQILRQGVMVSTARTEIIVNDGQMYQYLFHRIANAAPAPGAPEMPSAGQPGADQPRRAAPPAPAFPGQP